MSEDNVYKDGDIVWVKLGTNWWPGEVCGLARQPPGLLNNVKKKPYCVVKFFQEDSFEYVKTSKQIFPYRCNKRNEFIRKGYALYKAKNKFMDKFPSDVQIAEGLATEIYETPSIIINNRPDSIVKAILGQALVRTSADYSNSYGRRSNDTITRIINITPTLSPARTSFDNNKVSTHNTGDVGGVNINMTTPNRSVDGGGKSNANSNAYRCNLCDFTSLRQNVMILHRKSHTNSNLTTPSGSPKESGKYSIESSPITPSSNASKIIESPIQSNKQDKNSSKKNNYNGKNLEVTSFSQSKEQDTHQLNTSSSSSAIVEKKPKTKKKIGGKKSKRKSSKVSPSVFVDEENSKDIDKKEPLDNEVTDDHSNGLQSPDKVIEINACVNESVTKTPEEEIAENVDLPKSSSQILGKEPDDDFIPTLETKTIVNVQKSNDDLPKSSSEDSVKLVAVAERKSVKRNSEDIRKTLLADWSDEEDHQPDNNVDDESLMREKDQEHKYKEQEKPGADEDLLSADTNQEDNHEISAEGASENSTNMEGTETNCTLENQTMMSATSEPMVIVTTPPLQSKIRNIPKKDRRDIILKEFDNDNHKNVDFSPLTEPNNKTKDEEDIANAKNLEENLVIDEQTSPVCAPATPTTKIVQTSTATATATATPTFSCFDFQEDEEDGDSELLTSIANFKKKYLSPDRMGANQAISETARKSLELKDKQLSDEIESLLNNSASTIPTLTVTMPIPSENQFEQKMAATGRCLLIKERGKRIFKSRNRSQYEESKTVTSPNASLPSAAGECQEDNSLHNASNVKKIDGVNEEQLNQKHLSQEEMSQQIQVDNVGISIDSTLVKEKSLRENNDIVETENASNVMEDNQENQTQEKNLLLSSLESGNQISKNDFQLRTESAGGPNATEDETEIMEKEGLIPQTADNSSVQEKKQHQNDEKVPEIVNTEDNTTALAQKIEHHKKVDSSENFHTEEKQSSLSSFEMNEQFPPNGELKNIENPIPIVSSELPEPNLQNNHIHPEERSSLVSSENLKIPDIHTEHEDIKSKILSPEEVLQSEIETSFDSLATPQQSNKEEKEINHTDPDFSAQFQGNFLYLSHEGQNNSMQLIHDKSRLDLVENQTENRPVQSINGEQKIDANTTQEQEEDMLQQSSNQTEINESTDGISSYFVAGEEMEQTQQKQPIAIKEKLHERCSSVGYDDFGGEESIPLIVYSPVEIYGGELQEHNEEDNAATEDTASVSQVKEDEKKICDEETEEEDEIPSPPLDPSITPISMLNDGIEKEECSDSNKIELQLQTVNNPSDEIIEAENFSRLTSPSDENSSVAISEADAEFGSPTSMLDDERLPNDRSTTENIADAMKAKNENEIVAGGWRKSSLTSQPKTNEKDELEETSQFEEDVVKIQKQSSENSIIVAEVIKTLDLESTNEKAKIKNAEISEQKMPEDSITIGIEAEENAVEDEEEEEEEDEDEEEEIESPPHEELSDCESRRSEARKLQQEMEKCNQEGIGKQSSNPILETSNPFIHRKNGNTEIGHTTRLQGTSLVNLQRTSPETLLGGEELSAAETLLLIPRQGGTALEPDRTVPIEETQELINQNCDQLLTEVKVETPLVSPIIEDDSPISKEMTNARRKRRSHMKVTPRKRIINEQDDDFQLSKFAGTKIRKLEGVDQTDDNDRDSSPQQPEKYFAQKSSKEKEKTTMMNTNFVTETRSFRPRRVTNYYEGDSQSPTPMEMMRSAAREESTTKKLKRESAKKNQNQFDEPKSPSSKSVFNLSNEKVRINVDVAHPLSTQIATILATNRLPSNQENLTNKVAGSGPGRKRKQTIEDDIPSFVIERPNKSPTNSISHVEGGETIAHMQTICPKLQVTRKETREKDQSKVQTKTMVTPISAGPPQMIFLNQNKKIVTTTGGGTATDSDNVATMLDFGNMPIMLSNENIIHENVHLVITPSSTPSTSGMSSASSSQQILMQVPNTTSTMSSSSTTSGVLFNQQQLPIHHKQQQQQLQHQQSTNVRTKRTPSRQQIQSVQHQEQNQQMLQFDQQNSQHLLQKNKEQKRQIHQKQKGVVQQFDIGEVIQNSAAQQKGGFTALNSKIQQQLQPQKSKQMGVDSRGNKYVIIKSDANMMINRSPPIQNVISQHQQQQQLLQQQTQHPQLHAQTRILQKDEHTQIENAGSTYNIGTGVTIRPIYHSPVMTTSCNVALPSQSQSQRKEISSRNNSIGGGLQQSFTQDEIAITACNQQRNSPSEMISKSQAPSHRRPKNNNNNRTLSNQCGQQIIGDSMSSASMILSGCDTFSSPPAKISKPVDNNSFVDALTQQQQLQQQRQIVTCSTDVNSPQQIDHPQIIEPEHQIVHSTTRNDSNVVLLQPEKPEGETKILAVPIKGINGFGATFLLCHLVDNQYKPIDNVPLYLNQELNKLVPVPDEALVGDIQITIDQPPDRVMQSEVLEFHVTEDQTNSQIHADETADGVITTADLQDDCGDAAGAITEELSTQFYCLQDGDEENAGGATVIQEMQHVQAISQTVGEDGEEHIQIYIPPGYCPDLNSDDTLILNVEGEHIALNTSVFGHLLSNPNANTNLITSNGREYLLTRDVIDAIEASNTAQQSTDGSIESQQIQIVTADDMLLQQHSTDDDDDAGVVVVSEAAGASDILAVALAGSDLYGNEILEIETSNGMQLVGTDGVVYQQQQHLTPPTAQTNATNVFNQKPIMSTLEVKSSNKGAIATHVHRHEIIDASAVVHSFSGVGVSSDEIGRSNLDLSLVTQPSIVPTSLELPITVTNPAIARNGLTATAAISNSSSSEQYQFVATVGGGSVLPSKNVTKSGS